MPQIRVHSLYEAFINITVASPRPEGTPAHIIPNAAEHDEIAAQVRAAMREYKHLGENEIWVPNSKQVQTYLPAVPSQFYAVRTLDPAGSLVEVDEEYFLDVLRVRYSIVFAVLPGALLADERIGEAYESNWQRAFKDLFTIGYSLPGVFIPGDKADRDDTKTTIDITLELGGAKGTMPFHKTAG